MTTRRSFFVTKERKFVYRTVEIYHPADGGILRRLVMGKIDPVDLRLEASAPRNAGLLVEYEGAYFEYQIPEQSTGSTVSTDIQLGRVGSEMKQILKRIQGASRLKVGEVIIREWFKGQESFAPDIALRLFIRSIGITPNGVVIRAEQDNPADRDVSTRYLIDVFKGLAEGI